MRIKVYISLFEIRRYRAGESVFFQTIPKDGLVEYYIKEDEFVVVNSNSSYLYAIRKLPYITRLLNRMFRRRLRDEKSRRNKR